MGPDTKASATGEGEGIDPEPWRHGYVAANALKFHYVTAGKGPLCLLLHGFPEFWWSWRHQIPVLAERFRVVAPDMRGYNLSDKPAGVRAYSIERLVEDVGGIVDALGERQAVLVGHDWGGVVAFAAAARRPDLVSKLVVMNAPHPAVMARRIWTPAQLRKSWYIFFFQLPRLPERWLARDGHRAVAAALRAGAIRKEAFSDGDLDAYREAAARPGALTAMLNYYRAATRVLPWRAARSPRIEAPTLLVWGEDDFALGKGLTEGLDRWVRRLQVRYIPGCGHWVQQEAAAEVNDALREFLFA